MIRKGCHNTPEANLRFSITWAETNIRWELGNAQPDYERIAACRQAIAESKEKLERIPNPYWPGHNCLGTALKP